MSSGRQLAAIMFTDIVAYTRLMQRDEQQALALIKHYHDALKTIVARHEGKVLNDYGDGSLCIFPYTTTALDCALDLQAELQAPPVVPLRIGIHVGEVFFEEDKALGDGVNVASRIQSLGQANTILFSKEVLDKIKNHPEFKAAPLGSFTFKDVEEPIEVFALANDGLQVPRQDTLEGKLQQGKAPRRRTGAPWLLVFLALAVLGVSGYLINRHVVNPTTPAGKENTLAVLYFSNMSGDPAQEYFSDGMTEEIISRLARIGGLKVKSRTSVLQYKSGTKDTRQIANELGVANILEGSVRKQGNMVRITAQLINASTDEHIWSEDYDRELKDVFAVQSEIAQQIASRFQPNLSEASRKGLSTNPTDNMEAYEHYLKARSLSFSSIGFGGQQEFTQKAIAHLKQAIQLDPRFADAYALLSSNYTYYSTDASNPVAWLDSAMAAARKAIELSPDREPGYIALSRVEGAKGNYDEAIKWLMKAHDIVPYSTAGEIAANYLRKTEFGKAYEWIQKAKAYDPAETAGYLSSEGELFMSLGIQDSVKASIYQARNIKREAWEIDALELEYRWLTGNKEAYEQLTRKMYPLDTKEQGYQLGKLYLFQRQWKVADSLYAVSTKPDDMDAGLAKLQLGDKVLGRQYLEKAINRRTRFIGFNDYWHFYDISRCYAALQDPRYIDYLNRALERGWHYYTFFINDPFFDTVRQTPAFKKLAQKVSDRNERFKAEFYAATRRLAQ